MGGLPDKIVVATLKEYANETGYIKIKGNTVKLNKKGLKTRIKVRNLNTNGIKFYCNKLSCAL